MSLIEIFKYNSDVHIDNDHIVDNDETCKIYDGEQRVAAVAVGLIAIMWVAIGIFNHKRFQNVVPTG